MNLDIYLQGEFIGHTAPRSRGAKFVIEYTASVIEANAPESVLLSCSLPTPGPSTPSHARAFLEGLLPEGHALEVMAARVRGVRLTADDAAPAMPPDSLALLAEYGRECAGAVTLLPGGSPRQPNPGYRPLTDTEVAQRLTRLPEAPLGTDTAADIRMSLAGNQPKLLLARRGSAWLEPTGGAPSTHILKPTGQWPASAANEAITLGLARAVDLTPTHAWVESFGGTRTLVAERFDRRADPASGVVERLHQEDFCQALGMRPRDKYTIGRPSARMAPLLRSVPGTTSADVRTLLRQVAFRAIVGDEDGHGKNYGLTITNGEVHMAPLYDCLVTLIYPELSGTMGTPIGRARTLMSVDLDALVDEGAACGIPETQARAIVLDLADTLRAALGSINRPDADARTAEAITDTVSRRINRLNQGLPLGAAPTTPMVAAGPRRVGGTMDEASRPR